MNGFNVECICTVISILVKEFEDLENKRKIITYKGNFEKNGEVCTLTVDEKIANELLKYRYQPVKLNIALNTVNGRTYLKAINYEVLKK